MICPSTLKTSFITSENKQIDVETMLRIFKRVNWKSKMPTKSGSTQNPQTRKRMDILLALKYFFRKSSKWLSLDHWCGLYCKYNCKEYRTIFQDLFVPILGV